MLIKWMLIKIITIIKLIKLMKIIIIPPKNSQTNHQQDRLYRWSHSHFNRKHASHWIDASWCPAAAYLHIYTVWRQLIASSWARWVFRPTSWQARETIRPDRHWPCRRGPPADSCISSSSRLFNSQNPPLRCPLREQHAVMKCISHAWFYV